MSIKRYRKSSSLVQALEEYFEHTPHPDRTQLELLSKQHDHDETALYKWFWLKRKKRAKKLYKAAKAPPRKVSNHQSGHYTRGGSLNSELDEEPDFESPSSSVYSGPTKRKTSNSLRSYNNTVPDLRNEQFHSLPGSSTPSVENEPVTMPILSPLNDGSLANFAHPGVPQMSVSSRAQFRTTMSPSEIEYCHSSVGELLGQLVPREINILERIFNEVPDPSNEDISRLASRFVREKEKEDEIMSWFSHRRSLESTSGNRVTQEELQFEISDQI